MKNIILIALAALSLSFVTVPEKAIFSGKWVETWSYDLPSDVTYQDEYTVVKKQGGYSITCTTHPSYTFDNIKTSGTHLAFVLVNGEHRIPYELDLASNKKTMLGTAVGIRGNTVKIRWKRKR